MGIKKERLPSFREQALSYGDLYDFLMKCTDGIAKRNDNLLAGDVDFDGKIDMVDVYIIKSFCDAPAE